MNARCIVISRVKFSRMVNMEFINNHSIIFSRGKYSRIEDNPRNSRKISPSKITRYTVYALFHLAPCSPSQISVFTLQKLTDIYGLLL